MEHNYNYGLREQYLSFVVYTYKICIELRVISSCTMKIEKINKKKREEIIIKRYFEIV